MNQNRISKDGQAVVLFIDMNSFFASCEQQENYWLRGRPVGVCVYTGKYGCIIAPSIEAKKQGIKTGMRLNEAIRICPELVPLETNPDRYRSFHVKIIKILKRYSEDVIPKSIDEAVVNLTNYKLIYNDVVELAKKIKQDINREVGDWLKCSIGIAPNAFLAKLASGIKKPDGLTVIDEGNIDEVIGRLNLVDLPGISSNMAWRLQKHGINNPLQLRYAQPDKVKNACQSVVGLYWHYRLNFSEVDLSTHDYKSMQAMRQISASQRENVEQVEAILLTLCTTLERRMVRQNVLASDISVTIRYEDGRWGDMIKPGAPIQEATEILRLIKLRMKQSEKLSGCEALLNDKITSIGIGVFNFVDGDLTQFNMFENTLRKDNLRKLVYDIKSKFGNDKLVKAVELTNGKVLKDVIGFGSVKDLDEDYMIQL